MPQKNAGREQFVIALEGLDWLDSHVSRQEIDIILHHLGDELRQLLAAKSVKQTKTS